MPFRNFGPSSLYSKLSRSEPREDIKVATHSRDHGSEGGSARLPSRHEHEGLGNGTECSDSGDWIDLADRSRRDESPARAGQETEQRRTRQTPVDERRDQPSRFTTDLFSTTRNQLNHTLLQREGRLRVPSRSPSHSDCSCNTRGRNAHHVLCPRHEDDIDKSTRLNSRGYPTVDHKKSGKSGPGKLYYSDEDSDEDDEMYYRGGGRATQRRHYPW